MPDDFAPAIVRTVKDAMNQAANYSVTALDQFKWAEFALAGNIEAILLIGRRRKAWLRQECERIGNAPVQQGHPLDGRRG